MSLERQVNISCPQCQIEQETTVWDSLNAQVSPHAKEALIKGNLNVFRCAGCDFQQSLRVGLLYHDMGLKFVAQYLPYQLIEDDDETIFRSFRLDGGLEMEFPGSIPTQERANYMLNPHVVFQMSELVRYIIYREKLALFHLTNSD
ncbi:hypothetical protein EON83_07560 [bacterium]|nr:MAG: hypothetical protein EON83_07560 [bacterium]